MASPSRHDFGAQAGAIKMNRRFKSSLGDIYVDPKAIPWFNEHKIRVRPIVPSPEAVLKTPEGSWCIINFENDFANCDHVELAKRNIIWFGECTWFLKRFILQRSPMADIGTWIGDGSLLMKKENHLPGIIPENFFYSYNYEDKPFNTERQGWAFVASRCRTNRDFVCRWLFENQDIFEYPNYFVYDAITMMSKKYHVLKDRMFREPLGETPASINFSVSLRANDDPFTKPIVQMVCDTAFHSFEFSPHAIKTILSKSPFIILGCPNYYRYVKKMGFKTFAPHIDESFDQIADHMTRVNMACESMRKFLASDIDIEAIKNICDHNFNHAQKIIQRKYHYEQRQVRQMLQIIRKK